MLFGDVGGPSCLVAWGSVLLGDVGGPCCLMTWGARVARLFIFLCCVDWFLFFLL